MVRQNGKVALGLCLIALVFLVGFALWALPDKAAQINVASDTTSAHFWLNDSLVFANDTCVVASWQVEGVRSLRFNDAGVIGADHRSLCTSTATLELELPDGTEQSLTLTRDVVFELLPARLIIAFSVVLLVSAALFAPQTRHLFISDSSRVGQALPPKGMLLAACTIVLMGIALRTDFLSAPMRTDEAWTFNEFVSAPLAQSLISYRAANNHPLHTFLAHLSYLTFGGEPWALRLPAFFAGILIIPLTLRVGASWYGRYSGLLAAGLVAASSHLVAYSTNARGYTLVTACFLGLLWLAPKLAKSGKHRHWLIYSILTVAGFYSVPTMLYAFAVVWLWLLLTLLQTPQATRQQGLIRLFFWTGIAGGITLALYAPALLMTLRADQSSLSLSNLKTLTWQAFAEGTTFILRLGWQIWNTDLGAGISALLVLGFVIAVLFHGRVSRQNVSLTPIVLIVSTLLVFVQLGNTYLRLWLFLLPLYFIISAGGIMHLVRWLAGFRLPAQLRLQAHASAAVLIVTVGLSGILALQVHLTRSAVSDGETGIFNEPEEIVNLLQQTLQPTDYVLCSESCHQLRFYLNRVGLSHVELGHSRGQMQNRRVFVVVVDSRQTLDEMYRYGISPDQFQAPVLIHKFPTSALYVTEPL